MSKLVVLKTQDYSSSVIQGQGHWLYTERGNAKKQEMWKERNPFWFSHQAQCRILQWCPPRRSRWHSAWRAREPGIRKKADQNEQPAFSLHSNTWSCSLIQSPIQSDWSSGDIDKRLLSKYTVVILSHIYVAGRKEIGSFDKHYSKWISTHNYIMNVAAVKKMLNFRQISKRLR